MDAAYLKAAHPEPFTILGKRLLPFCLGYEILFQRFGNKFSVECDKKPELIDLFTGVFICSRPYHKNSSLNGFSIPWRAKWLGAAYLEKAKAMFHQYVAAHTELPDFYTKGDDNHEPIGSPTVQVVKVSLMANLHLSEMDALNKPFSLAFWDHLRFMESQGGIQIIDEAEKEKIKKEVEYVNKMEGKLNELAKRLVAEGRLSRPEVYA